MSRMSDTPPAGPRSRGRDGLRELVVGADPAVLAEHEEVEAARGDRAPARGPHLPAEGDRVVMARSLIRGGEDVALGAHEAIVGGGDAGLDRLVIHGLRATG